MFSMGYRRLLHGWRVRTIFMHELQKIRKRMSERSEQVSLAIFYNKCVMQTMQYNHGGVICLCHTYTDYILYRHRKAIKVETKY